jgi:hypothetical protein
MTMLRLTKLIVCFFLNFYTFLEITIHEQFTFCFNNILADVAANFPHVRDIIINSQIELLEQLISKIINFTEEEGSSKSEDDKIDAKCKNILKILTDIKQI